MRSVSAEENKSRVLELIERVMNGHDADALAEFTSNPAVLGAAQGLLHAFPDLEARVQWIVAENDNPRHPSIESDQPQTNADLPIRRFAQPADAASGLHG
jgi:hypothetical protein